jgi:2-aminoadipate transaminase
MGFSTEDLEPSALQLALGRASDQNILSLALGLPAPELFPAAKLAEACEATFLEGARSFQYGMPEWQLREHIVQLMKSRGVSCTADEVFLTTGAQQALSLIARLLWGSGDGTVLVDEAVYPGFVQALHSLSPTLIPIPSPNCAEADFESRRRSMQRSICPAFFYTLSAGHNPLSRTMTDADRRSTINFARMHNVPIIEDDVYGLLQYDGSIESPLKSLDPDWVFYVGSFSKILAPSLRTGWIIAPKRYIKRLSILKEGTDINTATFSQRIVRHFLDSHSIIEHVEQLRMAYQSRRNLMGDALQKHLPQISGWTNPKAGFFFWIESPMFGNTSALLELALNHGVSFMPGAAFAASSDRDFSHAIRLSFSFLTGSSINEAVTRLAAALDSSIHNKSGLWQ